MDDEATSLIFERAIRTETVFARSQQLAVSFYSNLPVEVKQILKNSGESPFHSPSGCDLELDLCSFYRLLPRFLQWRC